MVLMDWKKIFEALKIPAAVIAIIFFAMYAIGNASGPLNSFLGGSSLATLSATYLSLAAIAALYIILAGTMFWLGFNGATKYQLGYFAVLIGAIIVWAVLHVFVLFTGDIVLHGYAKAIENISDVRLFPFTTVFWLLPGAILAILGCYFGRHSVATGSLSAAKLINRLKYPIIAILLLSAADQVLIIYWGAFAIICSAIVLWTGYRTAKEKIGLAYMLAGGLLFGIAYQLPMFAKTLLSQDVRIINGAPLLVISAFLLFAVVSGGISMLLALLGAFVALAIPDQSIAKRKKRSRNSTSESR